MKIANNEVKITGKNTFRLEGQEISREKIEKVLAAMDSYVELPQELDLNPYLTISQIRNHLIKNELVCKQFLNVRNSGNYKERSLFLTSCKNEETFNWQVIIDNAGVQILTSAPHIKDGDQILVRSNDHDPWVARKFKAMVNGQYLCYGEINTRLYSLWEEMKVC